MSTRVYRFVQIYRAGRRAVLVVGLMHRKILPLDRMRIGNRHDERVRVLGARPPCVDDVNEVTDRGPLSAGGHFPQVKH